jgi:putative colanic acid biosynthesis UDP-glucose lipid carrier transferase
MEVHENILQEIVDPGKVLRPVDGSPKVTARTAGLVTKRVFDVLLSSLIILLIFPWLFPIVFIAILLDSKGGIFFVQKRNGLNNEVFRCFKFRTMVVNDDADLVAAGENDYRITRIGNFLRVSGIDELPQLINVLLGDMSLVGPRPHMIHDNLRFEKIAENYNCRNLVKPGITGLAQVNGYKGNIAGAQDIKMRTLLDLQYVRSRNLALDIKIITATARLMFVEVRKMGKGR